MNNSSSNSLSAAEMWIWNASFLLESIAIIFANTFTVHVFWNQRRTFKRTSYLLMNLALADLTVGISVGCFAVENQISSFIGTKPTRIGCLTVEVFSLSASITFLVALALERMHAVYWPLRHRLTRTRTYLYVISIIWFFSGTVTVSFILSYIGIISIIISLSFYVIIMALLPITICITYCITWLGVKYANHHNIRKHCNTETKKLTKTLLIASIISVVTWLPMSATLLVQIVCKNCISLNMTNRVVYLSRIFQYGNSLLNPVVYSIKIPEFKEKVIHLICKHSSHRLQKQVMPLKCSANVASKSGSPILLSLAPLNSENNEVFLGVAETIVG